MDKVNALLDLRLELGHHGVQGSLLVGVEGAEAVDLLAAAGADLDLAGEEGGVGNGGLDVGALHDVGGA